MENILPLAHRRNPQTIKPQLNAEPTTQLHTDFNESLHQLYKFYAAEAQNDDKSTSSLTVKAKNFDDMEKQTSRARSYRRASTMYSFNSREYGDTKTLSFEHWIKFCSDFGMSSSMLLTKIEVGDIYLGCVATTEKTGMRKMKFQQFWEALVRCALTAYRSITNATTANKIRALFVYMWKHVVCVSARFNAWNRCFR